MSLTLRYFFTNILNRICLNKNNKGVTLVELLMAMIVFIIAAGAITGVFITGIKQQANILIYQGVLDQMSYNLEFMSRNLRLAVKDTLATDPSGICIPVGTNYQVTRGGLGLKFINHMQKNLAGNDDCQEFFLENNQIKFRRQIGQLYEGILPLTSSRIQVTSLRFSLSGESQADSFQPLITISAQIQATTTLGRRILKMHTSISQRNLDVNY